jgi:hypothetical protein
MSEIKRYAHTVEIGSGRGSMDTAAEGPWMLYSDHERALAERDAQIRDLTARLAALTVAAQEMYAQHYGMLCDTWGHPDDWRKYGAAGIEMHKRMLSALTVTAAEVRERVKVALLDVQLKGEDPDQGCDRLLAAIAEVSS